jgi:ABC-type Fe3+ transport system permease subunit
MAVTNLVRKAARYVALNAATDAHVTSPAAGGFSRFWRTLKQTFHEVVAAIFAVLALAWLQSAIRAWTRDVSRWLIGAALAVAVLLAVFAWTSFRRGRELRP